tara:strand:- start:872 stop:1237 length:366 start_codon:yes stop_codon:yes gene_type:complete
MSWESILKETGPYKGSKKRQERGWDTKLDTREDTNIFLQVLVDIYGWSKKDIMYFLEKPYKWQDEYEIFKRALDLRHYSNDNIDDDLDWDSFADWYLENYPDLNWKALKNDLDEIEQVRAE